MCSEIYNLTCERRCDSLTFDTRDKNMYIFNGERVIITKCHSRSTVNNDALKESLRIDNWNKDEDVLMVSCSEVNVQHDENHPSIMAKDCVNGTWFPNDFNGGSTNYSHLMKEVEYRREEEAFREPKVAFEPDITIYNKTKLVEYYFIMKP